jgi:Holliday junction DNA helicase RuvA
MEARDLLTCVLRGDVARLTGIPGIGKKTAERIGLELKDRLPAALQAIGQAGAAAAPGDQLRDDLLSALLNLGYQRGVAEKAIDRTLKDSAPGGFEQALRDVLRGLMKG